MDAHHIQGGKEGLRSCLTRGNRSRGRSIEQVQRPETSKQLDELLILPLACDLNVERSSGLFELFPMLVSPGERAKKAVEAAHVAGGEVVDGPPRRCPLGPGSKHRRQ